MRRVTILLVLATVAFGVTGCGGSESSADTSTTTVAEKTTTETTEATETETTTETETNALGGLATGDCRKLVEDAQQLSQAFSTAAADTENLRNAEKAFQKFVDKAPEEIRADLQVLADALSKYVEVLGNIDIKPGETPSADTIQKLQEALASIDEAKVQAASDRLDAWAKKNCGVTP